jgi:dihydrofolate reductase
MGGALKTESSGLLAIMGSGVLIGSLMGADLIDEYLLMIPLTGQQQPRLPGPTSSGSTCPTRTPRCHRSR